MNESTNNETLNPHSVEISRGQSGKVSFSVKCYGETGEAAAQQSLAVFNQLKQKLGAE